MDDIAGAFAWIIGLIIGISAVVWLIGVVVSLLAIAVMIAIGVAAVAGPPIALGALLRKLIAKRYTLSRRKKWQCAGVSLAALSLPFLVLLVDTSMEAKLAAVWAGTVLSMSSVAVFLAASAYRQHFAEQTSALHQASSKWDEKSWRHKRSTRMLARLDKTLARAERKYGRLLQAQDSLDTRIETLVENNDPALCRIMIGCWERDYAKLPAKQIESQIHTVSRSVASVPMEHQATLRLQTLFLERLVLQHQLSKHRHAARYEEMRAERETLRAEASGCLAAMSECKRIQGERQAKIAQLKQKRLVIQ